MVPVSFKQIIVSYLVCVTNVINESVYTNLFTHENAHFRFAQTTKLNVDADSTKVIHSREVPKWKER